MLFLLALAGTLSVSDVFREFSEGAPVIVSEERAERFTKVGEMTVNELEAELTLDEDGDLPQNLEAYECRQTAREQIVVCFDESKDRYLILRFN